jgi:hypothetical protein
MRHNFFYRNALSIVFLFLTLFSLAGQAITGLKEYNEFLSEHGQQPVAFGQYLSSGHFLQATFENWESEFFQIALFVILTIYLHQEGSSESSPLEEGTEKEGETIPHEDSPWALKKGGWIAGFYNYSLSIALTALFLFSFAVHWYGSWKDYNHEQLIKGGPTEQFLAYLGQARFWFESFQNWQSEFLSIFAIIFLSIFLRQKGSPQSKRVNDSHDKTGE